ncbi:pancreatic secretory granule membrane major glycoprotein GP2-like [Heteronotia binoei]|uniref:pancreatic secretory granule membrane major glycoprotein GP2-like n=1 Tax=Heteronotia binoei TaxID=13085 RepID=UPI00292F28E4|nr:pancreatic secretory granule membrane major glycoprotein GP2-like [Heteronotia binoei]
MSSSLLIVVLLLAGVGNCHGQLTEIQSTTGNAVLQTPKPLGPCSSSPCWNQGVCSVVEGNPNCTCKPGFMGPFCKEMVVDLQCEEEFMRMMVRKEVFKMFNIPMALVHLKNSNCKVSEQDEGGAAFFGAKLTKENHTECGSLIQVNGSHVSYANEIQTDREDDGVITRTVVLNVRFSCIYAYTRVVGLQNPLRAVDTLVQFAVKEGDFTVTMALYESSAYNQVYSQQRLFSLLLTDTLYVLLQIEGQQQVKYFFLSVEDCWGTPRSDPNHSLKHHLIMKGCPHDKTVIILNDIGASTMAKFSFQMFQFKNFTEVYLHCQVRLCIPENQEPCAKQCPSKSKRKRAMDDNYSKIVSYGPIRLLAPASLETKNTTPKSSQKSPPWDLQLWIPGAVVSVGIGIAVILTAVAKAMKK